MATVTGTVTHNGQPVTGGSLQFAPTKTASGKDAMPAEAEVGSDGKFVLSSGDAKGAAVGTHTITYSAPPAEFPEGYEPKPGDVPKPSQWEGLVPETPQQEVKPGSNEIEIKLVKGAKK
jgi:hypothetical protein